MLRPPPIAALLLLSTFSATVPPHLSKTSDTNASSSPLACMYTKYASDFHRPAFGICIECLRLARRTVWPNLLLYLNTMDIAYCVFTPPCHSHKEPQRCCVSCACSVHRLPLDYPCRQRSVHCGSDRCRLNNSNILSRAPLSSPVPVPLLAGSLVCVIVAL